LLVADEYFLIRFKLFSFSTKLLLAFDNLLTENIKSLIARVSLLFSFGYHRLGYGFGLAVA